MTFLSAVVLLGILIFVHEFGHFLFAKLLGIRVLKFSLGFGPKLIGKKIGETEYVISAVPLGGYVKPLGEEPGEELKEEDKPYAFNYQPVWKRAAVALSGPVFNLLFAAFIFFFIFLSGVPVSQPNIGKVLEGSPAAASGLMTGDRVMEIDGTAVTSWDDIERAVNDKGGRTLLFRVNRGGSLIEVPVRPVRKKDKNVFGEDREVWDIGASPLLAPDVGEVVKDSQAEKAGVRAGDRVIGIDGEVVKTWQDMTALIHESPGKPLKFRIRRGGEVMELVITPRKETVTAPTGEKKEIGLIGIKPKGGDLIRKFGPIEAVSLGIKKTWELSVLTIVAVVKLIQRIVPAETLGGPIMIMQMAGQQAAHGAKSFFSLMAVISINLGVLNLLPIPILDGGHIMFLTIEALRRKPLSERILIMAQKIGLAFIIVLMTFALYNDIMRIVIPWIRKLFDPAS